MPITEILAKNAREFTNDVCLVEVNPQLEEKSRRTWKEYSLIEAGTENALRRELTWGKFDKKANRFANLLLTRGIKKGDKVLLILKRNYEYWYVAPALHKLGAVMIPATNLLVEHDFSYRFKAAGVSAIICTADGKTG